MNLISRTCRIVGYIELFTVNDRGQEVILARGPNTVTYEGMDALGKILAGSVSTGINAMYFGFENGGAPAVVTSGASYSSSDFRSLSGTADFVRVRISSGIEAASGGSYASNQVTFVGIAPSGIVAENNALTIFSNALSDITHFGLAIAPVWSDNTQDFLYAAYTPGAVIAVPTTGIGMRWQTKFEV